MNKRQSSHSIRWLLAATVGVGLVLPAAWYWGWIILTDPVRPADEDVAFERLAVVPISRAEDKRTATTTFVVPSGPSWERLVRNWGDPGFIIAVAPLRDSTHLYCLKDLGVAVQITVAGKPVHLDDAEYAPYGFSINCKPAGLQFKASPKTTVRLIVELSTGSYPPAEIIVVPYWLGYTSMRGQLSGARRLPHFLGNVQIGHKTGDLGTVANDVGIIYARSGPIVVASFNQNITGIYAETEDRIGMVARTIVDYFDGAGRQ